MYHWGTIRLWEEGSRHLMSCWRNPPGSTAPQGRACNWASSQSQGSRNCQQGSCQCHSRTYTLPGSISPQDKASKLVWIQIRLQNSCQQGKGLSHRHCCNPRGRTYRQGMENTPRRFQIRRQKMTQLDKDLIRILTGNRENSTFLERKVYKMLTCLYRPPNKIQQGTFQNRGKTRTREDKTCQLGMVSNHINTLLQSTSMFRQDRRLCR